MNKAVLGAKGTRLVNAGSIYSPWFQPAGAKFGDVPGLLKLGRGALWPSGGPAKEQSPVEAVLAD